MAEPLPAFTAGETFVSVRAARFLARGFGDQTLTFIRWGDAPNAAWAATHAGHYGRLAVRLLLEEASQKSV